MKNLLGEKCIKSCRSDTALFSWLFLQRFVIRVTIYFTVRIYGRRIQLLIKFPIVYLEINTSRRGHCNLQVKTKSRSVMLRKRVQGWTIEFQLFAEEKLSS